MGDAPAQLFLEHAFGLPTGQALIAHGDGNTELSAQAFGEPRGFLSHMAARAVQAQGQTDNDPLDMVLANELSEAAHIFIAIDAFEGVVRLGDARFAVGES